MSIPEILPAPAGRKPFFPPVTGRSAMALKSFLFSPARTYFNITLADLSTPPRIAWIAATKDGAPLAWRDHADPASLRSAAKEWMKPVIAWDDACAEMLPAGITLVPLRRIMEDWLKKDFRFWHDPAQFRDEVLIGSANMNLEDLPWPDKYPPEKDGGFNMKILLRGCLAMEDMLRILATAYYRLSVESKDF